TRPLHIFGLLGFIMGLLGTAVCAWMVWVKFYEAEGIGNRPLLLFGILLVFTGVQLITLGLLAEMQARTYHESQNKPIYVIRDVIESVSADTPHAVGA
ncbi:MAG: glycosyltransferase, partial [Acidobacteriota bacterium]